MAVEKPVTLIPSALRTRDDGCVGVAAGKRALHDPQALIDGGFHHDRANPSALPLGRQHWGVSPLSDDACIGSLAQCGQTQ